MLSSRLCRRACPFQSPYPPLSSGILAAGRAGQCRSSISGSSSSNTSSMDALSHSTAVCIIPPRDVWDQIQEIRCFKCAPHSHCAFTVPQRPLQSDRLYDRHEAYLAFIAMPSGHHNCCLPHAATGTRHSCGGRRTSTCCTLSSTTAGLHSVKPRNERETASWLCSPSRRALLQGLHLGELVF